MEAEAQALLMGFCFREMRRRWLWPCFLTLQPRDVEQRMGQRHTQVPWEGGVSESGLGAG